MDLASRTTRSSLRISREPSLQVNSTPNQTKIVWITFCHSRLPNLWALKSGEISTLKITNSLAIWLDGEWITFMIRKVFFCVKTFHISLTSDNKLRWMTTALLLFVLFLSAFMRKTVSQLSTFGKSTVKSNSVSFDKDDSDKFGAWCDLELKIFRLLGIKQQEEEQNFKYEFPPCNIEYKADPGTTRYWCTDVRISLIKPLTVCW